MRRGRRDALSPAAPAARMLGRCSSCERKAHDHHDRPHRCAPRGHWEVVGGGGGQTADCGGWCWRQMTSAGRTRRRATPSARRRTSACSRTRASTSSSTTCTSALPVFPPVGSLICQHGRGQVLLADTALHPLGPLPRPHLGRPSARVLELPSTAVHDPAAEAEGCGVRDPHDRQGPPRAPQPSCLACPAARAQLPLCAGVPNHRPSPGQPRVRQPLGVPRGRGAV